MRVVKGGRKSNTHTSVLVPYKLILFLKLNLILTTYTNYSLMHVYILYCIIAHTQLYVVVDIYTLIC